MPAEIVDRAVAASTDGPVEHVQLLCLRNHRFLMPIALMPIAPSPATAPRDCQRSGR